MLARTGRLTGIGAVFLIFLLVASCTVTPAGPGTQASVSFSILGQTVTITFGPVGRIRAQTNQTVTQTGVVRLFDQAPATRPPTATMRLLGSSVTSEGPINAKSATRAQAAIPQNGTATVRFFIAPGEVASTCSTGTLLASYDLTVVAGLISILDDDAELSGAAIDAIMANDVTICVELTANFDGEVIFQDFTLSFGGGDGGSGAAGVASFTLQNDGFENIHILFPGEGFDASNRITPGNVRTATLDVSTGDSISVRAGRDGTVLDTTTCPTVTGSGYTATVVWNGGTVTCDVDQGSDGGGGTSTPPGTTIQVPIDSPGGVAVAVPATATYNSIDYAVVGVLGANTPDTPPATDPGSVSIDLDSLGLASVDKLFMAVVSAFVPDLSNSVTLATLTCDYAEGGAPTTMDFTLGSTTAEWSFLRPEHTSIGGVAHDSITVLYSFPTTVDSAFEYDGWVYDVSLPMDSSRTLSSCTMTAASAGTFLPRPLVPEPTWAATSILGLTLVGPAGTPGAGGVPDDECNSDANCSSGEMCIGGVCVPVTPGCTSNLDCGADEACVDGMCVPGAGGGADCSGDGACNAACGDTDPDCAEVCVADGFCNANCSDLDPDPDCATVPTGQPKCTTSSSFDLGDEGWLILGDAQGGRGDPDFVASGGNPGGHISAKDDAQGGVWFFQAPVAYRGNFSGALGKTLTFDLKQSSLSSQFDWLDVSLTGGGLTIVVDAGSNPGLDWTSYSIVLDTSAGWTLNALDGTPATQADILAVLSDLTDMLIRGEYVDGPDTGGLDNAVLNSDCLGGGGADCSGDGTCNAECGDTDPDCAFCDADGVCMGGCPGIDPDCGCDNCPGECVDGVCFAQGDISFADFVITYDNTFGGNPAPTDPNVLSPASALGAPDYVGATDGTFVTLGQGGLLEVGFSDNVLTNSGDGQVDLKVFEIGPDVEGTFVSLRATGTTGAALSAAGIFPEGGWYEIGRIGGSTSSIDIDGSFPGFAPGALQFDAVRLRDDPDQGGGGGSTPGADIDAVGAIATRPV